MKGGEECGLGNNVGGKYMCWPMKKTDNTNTRIQKRGCQEAAMMTTEGRTETDLAASSAGLGRQLLARSDLDVLAGTWGINIGSPHTVLDLLGHGQESLLNVGGALSRCLQEGDWELVSEFLWWWHVAQKTSMHMQLE